MVLNVAAYIFLIVFCTQFAISSSNKFIKDPPFPSFPVQYNATFKVTLPTKVILHYTVATDYSKNIQQLNSNQSNVITVTVSDFTHHRQYTILQFGACLEQPLNTTLMPQNFLGDPIYMGTAKENGLLCDYWTGIFENNQPQQADYYQLMGESTPIKLKLADGTVRDYQSFTAGPVNITVPTICNSFRRKRN